MELKDGGLYETKHGTRFRVTEQGSIFVCRSFGDGGFWYSDGSAFGRVPIEGRLRKPHLIREIDESRWVPISKYVDAGMARVRCPDFKHRQKLVSRAEAKAIGEAGRIKGESKSDTAILGRVLGAALAAQPTVDSFAAKIPQTGNGTVELKDKWNFNVGFTWAISNDGKHSVLDIETTSGGKATFRL